MKTAMKDVVANLAVIRNHQPESKNPSSNSVQSPDSKSALGTMTNLVAEYAKGASSEEWIDLFDVLSGKH